MATICTRARNFYLTNNYCKCINFNNKYSRTFHTTSSGPKINKMSLPTVTIRELSDATQDKTLGPSTHKVLVGIINDYMDLQYAKETPYTTGQRVLPNETTLDDVDKAATDEGAEKKFRDVFQCIAETERSGDLTPKSINNNNWDPRFTPVLVLVTPNP